MSATMKINRDKVKRVFAEYVRNYNAEDPKVHLKIVHTIKVSELCEEIAESLDLNHEDIELAWLMGMLHDIGRFEQLRQYNTFYDALSVKHAELGCKILFEEGMLHKFVSVSDRDPDVEIIHKAIACHSNYRIPEEYDDRTKMFCNILRDADKIDIFRVNMEESLEDIYNFTTEELRNSEISEAVMENFRLHRATPREIRKAPIDYLVGAISMAFEIVYPKSMEILIRQGNLEQMMNFTSDNEKARHQFAILRDIMHLY